MKRLLGWSIASALDCLVTALGWAAGGRGVVVADWRRKAGEGCWPLLAAGWVVVGAGGAVTMAGDGGGGH